MDKYCVLLKTEPTKTNNVRQKLGILPERPYQGVRLYYAMNWFGTWDLAIWFGAETHDCVIDFVHDKIAPIPGVVETKLIRTTPIKEYINWK